MPTYNKEIDTLGATEKTPMAKIRSKKAVIFSISLLFFNDKNEH